MKPIFALRNTGWASGLAAFRAMAFLVFVGSCAWTLSAIADNTNLVANFDAETVGAPPSDWKTGGGGFASVTNDVFQSKPNSLALFNTTLGNASYAFRPLPQRILSNDGGRVLVSYRVHLEQQNATVNTMVTDGGTAFLIRVSFNNAGQITAWSAGKDIPVGAYEPGQWYRVRLEFVPLHGLYDLEIRTDTELVVSKSAVPFEAKEFVHVYFQNFGAASGDSRASFDEVVVVTDVRKAK